MFGIHKEIKGEPLRAAAAIAAHGLLHGTFLGGAPTHAVPVVWSVSAPGAEILASHCTMEALPPEVLSNSPLPK